MPEQPLPKLRPPIVHSDAEKRARDLAAGIAPAPGNEDPMAIALDALTNISLIAAQPWGSDREPDDALRRINELAVGAWAQIRRR